MGNTSSAYSGGYRTVPVFKEGQEVMVVDTSAPLVWRNIGSTTEFSTGLNEWGANADFTPIRFKVLRPKVSVFKSGREVSGCVELLAEDRSVWFAFRGDLVPFVCPESAKPEKVSSPATITVDLTQLRRVLYVAREGLAALKDSPRLPQESWESAREAIEEMTREAK